MFFFSLRCRLLKCETFTDPSKCEYLSVFVCHRLTFFPPTDIKMTPEEVEAQIRSFY
jgi:hypothetical protein